MKKTTYYILALFVSIALLLVGGNIYLHGNAQQKMRLVLGDYVPGKGCAQTLPPFRYIVINQPGLREFVATKYNITDDSANVETAVKNEYLTGNYCFKVRIETSEDTLLAANGVFYPQDARNYVTASVRSDTLFLDLRFPKDKLDSLNERWDNSIWFELIAKSSLPILSVTGDAPCVYAWFYGLQQDTLAVEGMKCGIHKSHVRALNIRNVVNNFRLSEEAHITSLYANIDQHTDFSVNVDSKIDCAYLTGGRSRDSIPFIPFTKRIVWTQGE